MKKQTLEQALEKLTQYDYIVTGNEAELKRQLQAANNTIRDFVSKFDRPEFVCPELVEYLNRKK